MSGSPNKNFIFVSPSKYSADYYGKNNLRNKKSAVVKGFVEGKIFNLEKSLADYEAFGEITKRLGMKLNNGFYDEKMILKELEKQGYAGFSFKDKIAGNREAFAVNPKYLKPEK